MTQLHPLDPLSSARAGGLVSLCRICVLDRPITGFNAFVSPLAKSCMVKAYIMIIIAVSVDGIVRRPSSEPLIAMNPPFTKFINLERKLCNLFLQIYQKVSIARVLYDQIFSIKILVKESCY
ncbi:hypothetical protein TNCT_355741 [Trichonephila clavata]|uniref:Uncharacterized protein n=1 Tax=Trichonephila clavata TaxID=2740835 RepID=A0A8X6H192_TRICU|nr:hypothetical protein TNCT_355741 [Trichonephila clavata]